MSVIGNVDSVWRYPVKSMRGEHLDEIFIGFSGVYGDRLFAVKSSECPTGFPYLTGRELNEMLLYQPHFRHRDKAAKPTNLAEAQSLAPGLNPVYADPADLKVDVCTPSGDVLAIDDPALIQRLEEKMGKEHRLTLVQSERSMTDCRPISLFSIQTGRQLGGEIGIAMDNRRFRANIYMDLKSDGGFSEDELVGRSVRIGSQVVVSVLERDPRCAMITFDPDTAQSNAKVLKKVAQGHEGMAGVYGAVLVEGMIRPGDEIEPLT